MAVFGNQGTFGNKQQALSPIEQLLQSTKQNKTAATQPANVFAPAATPAATPATTPANLTQGATTPGLGSDHPTLLDDGSEPGGTVPLPTTEGTAGGPPAALPTITPTTHYIDDDPNSPFYWQTLGYPDASWSGLPYEYGYVDADGNFVLQRDMSSIAQQLHDLQNIPMPDRPDLPDVTTSQPYQNLTDLISIIQNPATSAADRDAAIAQFEREMGQQPGWYAQQMGGMFNDLNQGVYNREGMPQDQLNAYNRETQLELQKQRDNYKMLLESMGAAGRDVAGYQKMDQIANSLSTFEMQRDLERINIDNAMKQTEYEALKGRWESLYNMGQMTAQQYVNEIQANRTAALQGYAQQLSAFVQQNQLTLDAYRADLEAVQTHAQTVYQGIMADMGVSQGMMEEMQSRYEMYYAPYYAALEQWSIQSQYEQQQKANQISAWSAIPIVGPIVAAAIASVICTELNRQGLMDDKTHELDSIFGQRIIMTRPDIYLGYLILATPIVEKMRESKVLTRIVNFFVKGWSKEMMFRMEAREKGSLLGKLIMKIGFPLCARIGGKHGCKLGPAESR